MVRKLRQYYNIMEMNIQVVVGCQNFPCSVPEEDRCNMSVISIDFVLSFLVHLYSLMHTIMMRGVYMHMCICPQRMGSRL